MKTNPSFKFRILPDGHRRVLLPLFAIALVITAAGVAAAPAAAARIDELVRHLASPVSALRIKAADGLGELGPEASSAVPALIRALTDEEVVVRNRAAAALGKIKKPADQIVPQLFARIEAPGEEWSVCHNAALALSWIGEPAVEVLKKGLKSARPMTRAYAADGLIRMESSSAHHSQILPVVDGLLADREVSNRAFAAQLVVRLGPAGAPTVPALVRLLDDPDGGVRVSAMQALLSVGSAATGAVPRVLRTLKEDQEQWARIHATELLGVVGGSREEAIHALIDSFGDRSDRVGAYAALALAKIGEPAVPGLLAVLKSTEKSRHQGALDALASMGTKAGSRTQSVADVLVTILERERDASLRFRAASALGFLGERGAAVLAALNTAAQDEDELVRVNARDALKRLGAAAPAEPASPRNKTSRS